MKHVSTYEYVTAYDRTYFTSHVKQNVNSLSKEISKNVSLYAQVSVNRRIKNAEIMTHVKQRIRIHYVSILTSKHLPEHLATQMKKQISMSISNHIPQNVSVCTSEQTPHLKTLHPFTVDVTTNNS